MKINVLHIVAAFNVIFFISNTIQAQHLPDEMHISPDGRMLTSGGNEVSGFFDESIVRKIELQFDQSDYWQQMQNNYQSSNDILATLWVDGVQYDSVGVRFKGQTSYSQNSTNKKSFNITLDFVNKNQNVMGYETLNLNCGWQDRSGMREVLYNHTGRNYYMSLKANFARLYINGQDWGPYQCVQQFNANYITEWYESNDGTIWRALRTGGMGFGTGTSTLNYNGPDTSNYQTDYTLKRSEKQNKWEDLLEGCDVLNNEPLITLEDSLKQYLDIDKTCWFLAHEIAFADDDSYINKGGMDYYVYWEAETDRLVPMEYDGNTVLSANNINWDLFENENDQRYPLLNRMLQVPSIRQRYLAHMRTILNNYFMPLYLFPKIDEFAALIDSLVQIDPQAIYNYNQFQSEQNALKIRINDRRTLLLSDAEMLVDPLTVSNISYSVDGSQWAIPAVNEEVDVIATVTGNAGVSSVLLHYSTGFTGIFEKVEMFDDGQHDDGSPNDDVFGASIPGMLAGTYVRYYIEAIANDNSKTVTYEPQGAEHDVYLYHVEITAAADQPIAINEIMADNETVVTDENGQFEDWIELFNITNASVDISGWFLTDDASNLDKWSFPSGTVMAPGEYLIVWNDEDGSQGPYHSNFKLSKNGESVFLLNNNIELVDEATYSNIDEDLAWARIPNGTGNFTEQVPTHGFNNEWMTSINESDDAVTGLEVFPNPVSDILYVHSTQLTIFDYISITNTVGQLIWKGTIDQRIELDVSNWRSGLYFLNANGSVEKIIVQSK